MRVEPIPRGRPEWASSEEDWILDLLREACEHGVSREYLIFTCKSTQCGRAIHGLEKRGFVIEHVKFKGERFVRYILRQEPLTQKPVSDDWYERQHGPRLTAKPLLGDLPLFAGVDE